MQINVGFDFVLFDYCLIGIFDYFNKVFDNILFEILLVDLIQLMVIFWINIFNMEICNSGFELFLDLGSNLIRELYWNIGGNIFLINNEIIDFLFFVFVMGIVFGVG